jgi:hypothetical protein
MPLPRAVTFPTAVVLTLSCAARALVVDALAGPLERLEFEGTSQRLISGGLILGDCIVGYLAKPEGAGPFSRGHRTAWLCPHARHDKAKTGR